MSVAVNQLIAEGVDEKEIHSFLEQLKPLTEPKPARSISSPVALSAEQIVSQTDSLKCRTVDMPPYHTFESWQATLINIAIGVAVPALGVMVGILRAVASANSLTIGFGPAIGGGFLVGGTASVGIICAPNDTFGFYGSFGALAGAIASISLTAQYTFMKGGMEAWAGANLGVTIAGGDVIVGSASLLMDEKENFAGVSIAAGLGIGSPLEIYVSYQKAFITVRQRIDCGDRKSVPIKNITHVTHNWESVQFASNSEMYYWLDRDKGLRQGKLKNGSFSDVKILDADWAGTELAAQKDFIFWSDGDQVLRMGKVKDGQIKDVIHLTDDWNARLFTADQEFLYWLDHGETRLLRGKIVDNKISEVTTINGDCQATQLLATGGYLYWTDGDKILRKGEVKNGKLVALEQLTTNWLAGHGQFAGHGNNLIWSDNDKILRQGEVT